MTTSPNEPSRRSDPKRGTAIITMRCPNCAKLTPHKTTGTKDNSLLGGTSQAMICTVCGTLSDVATGPDGYDFQANVDAPDGTE